MKIPFQKYLTTKWPAILWSVFVFLLLALPSSFFPHEKKVSISNIDKVAHFTLFALLVFFWGYYLKHNITGSFRKFFVIIILLSVFYGIAMEYVQLYTGRDFDVMDMVADAVGSVAGALLVLIKNKPR